MARGKRKRAPPPPTDIDNFASQLKADPSRPSFLDFPPELRTLIYEYVFASTGGIHLSRQTARRNLASTSALPRVNKQIHSEFSSAAWLLAYIITSSVALSFTHIVTFLNRLSDAELRALPTLHAAAAQRRITIVLRPGTALAHYGLQTLLERWLKRAGHPTKKGTDVVYEYVLHSSCTKAEVAQGMQELETYASRMPEGRRRAELRRIVAALR
ncbi:hypothetical protein B0A55_02841 [Friedmanniomyces simplex]|uniref:F-box domain-containing protein n=1 Tax=Friedmanniomyces simplex TaxID=329884 RepID=A0A4U0XV42_9PEZI|nr:hypothetical protein B0A55_02841 [Friedmanniomyces simplex]